MDLDSLEEVSLLVLTQRIHSGPQLTRGVPASVLHMRRLSIHGVLDNKVARTVRAGPRDYVLAGWAGNVSCLVLRARRPDSSWQVSRQDDGPGNGNAG